MSQASKPHKGEGHRGRLREKFLTSGLDGFHDYEVIELLLTLATPRKDCKDQAKAALRRFKTLQGVIEATPERLQEIKGIGPKKYFWHQVCPGGGRAQPKKEAHQKGPDQIFQRAFRLSVSHHSRQEA